MLNTVMINRIRLTFSPSNKNHIIPLNSTNTYPIRKPEPLPYSPNPLDHFHILEISITPPLPFPDTPLTTVLTKLSGYVVKM